MKEWRPNDGPQTEALSRSEFEILYGGARGGGKTDAGLAWIVEPTGHPQYRGLVIRRNADDLKDWIDRANELYSALGAKKVGTPAEFHFPSGAKIRTGHLKDEDAYTKYQGHEYHRILIEELTHIPAEESYLKLISSCRSTVDGLKPQVFCTTNPGGDGHLWVKARFVDPMPAGRPFFAEDEETGIKKWRIFIPAKVEDNPVLMEKDPGYIAWLNGLPDDLKKAWREGSWDVFEVKGAYYASEMSQARDQGRICTIPIEPYLDTDVIFDLGIDDTMAVGFTQNISREIRWIDYEELQDKGLDYVIRLMKEKDYHYGAFYFPHDIAVRELTTGRSRLEAFQEMFKNAFGYDPTVIIAPRMEIADGIQAVRMLFPRFHFDQTRAKLLVQRLNQYRKEWDENHQVYRLHPLHDQNSHGADMVRTYGVTFHDAIQDYDRPVYRDYSGGRLAV